MNSAQKRVSRLQPSPRGMAQLTMKGRDTALRQTIVD
jgi:hypothetical protein